MHFGADMMGDQPDDTLAIGSVHPRRACADTDPEPVDPEQAVRVEHDLDDLGVIEPFADRTSKGRAQHAGTAAMRFLPDRFCTHACRPLLRRT